MSLDAVGWRVVAESWGAGLEAASVDGPELRRLVARVRPLARIRELDADDTDRILALDASTANDYPGDVATLHRALDRADATFFLE